MLCSVIIGVLALALVSCETPLRSAAATAQMQSNMDVSSAFVTVDRL
jgi:hypothetical protein